MNILTDALPKKVEIGGNHYEINTDFRAGIAFEIMIQEGALDIVELLKMYFPYEMPKDVEGALSAIERFYCCGRLPEKETSKPTKGKQGYSFKVDASAIFADFWNFYNIDLSQEGLHWWAFRSLLECLPEKSEFKQRIYYRTCDTKGMSKKEKERIAKIRASLKIETNENKKITLEERNAEMLSYLQKRRAETGGVNNG